MSQKEKIEGFTIMPEHCNLSPGNATEIRHACDAFFRRRGMDVYGRRLEYGNRNHTNVHQPIPSPPQP